MVWFLFALYILVIIGAVTLIIMGVEISKIWSCMGQYEGWRPHRTLYQRVNIIENRKPSKSGVYLICKHDVEIGRESIEGEKIPGSFIHNEELFTFVGVRFQNGQCVFKSKTCKTHGDKSPLSFSKSS